MGIAIPTNFDSEIRNLGPICYNCIALNKTEEEQGKELRINCTRCDRPYCDKCASRTDPQFCCNCLTDFQAIIKDETYRGVEHIRVIDPSGGKEDSVVAIPYKTRYKQITLLGTDWLFYETAIANMSDTQLAAALQWHKAAVSEIEIEVTERKIKHAQHLAKQPNPKVSPIKKLPDNQKAFDKALKMMQTLMQMAGNDPTMMEQLKVGVANLGKEK
jgi:hypothetical protein